MKINLIWLWDPKLKILIIGDTSYLFSQLKTHFLLHECLKYNVNACSRTYTELSALYALTLTSINTYVTCYFIFLLKQWAQNLWIDIVQLYIVHLFTLL